MTDTVPAGQFRIEQVQILNWGGYAGLQVMRAGRTSMPSSGLPAGASPRSWTRWRR